MCTADVLGTETVACGQDCTLVAVPSSVAMLASMAWVVYHHSDQSTMQNNIQLDSAWAECVLQMCRGQGLLPADGPADEIAQSTRLIIAWHQLNAPLHLPNWLSQHFGHWECSLRGCEKGRVMTILQGISVWAPIRLERISRDHEPKHPKTCSLAGLYKGCPQTIPAVPSKQLVWTLKSS